MALKKPWLIVCLAAAGSVSAQPYVAAGLGATRAAFDCAGTTWCDKTDSGGKLMAGYMFTPNVAAELSYMDFGRMRATGTAEVDTGSGIVPVSVGVKLSSTAIGVGAAFFGELAPQWQAVARLGVAQLKAKVSASTLGIDLSDSDRHAKAYLGLALAYRLSPQLSINGELDVTRAEYSKIWTVSEPIDLRENGTVKLLSLGVLYRF